MIDNYTQHIYIHNGEMSSPETLTLSPTRDHTCNNELKAIGKERHKQTDTYLRDYETADEKITASVLKFWFISERSCLFQTKTSA